MVQNSRSVTMDGNTAAATASYYFTEVAAIYPITPSSPMAESVDKWAAEGKKNIFGQPVRMIEMQSEGGAAGALHGSLQAGALSTTYTSSQGLLLMIPNLYKIAGELLPGVLHVSARSLASNALSIFGDHQDVMSIRQTGVALLASGNVQECMDLGCIAHLTAIRSRIPFVHFFDGFRTSHEIQKIQMIEEEMLRPMVDWENIKAFRDRALNPDHPVLRGTTQNPDIFFQEREAVNPFYQATPELVQEYMDKIGEATGRQYHLFDYYGAEHPELVLIAMGSSCEVIKETIDYLNAQGDRYGLLQVRLFRPFSKEAFLKAFPKGVRKAVVLDRTKEPGAYGEPLYQEICSVFSEEKNPPAIIGGRYGLASKDFTPQDVAAVIKNGEQDKPLNGFTVGIKDDVTHLSLSPETKLPDTSPKGTVNCKFWGLGSDGTVSANKSAIKIIGTHTDKYVQAYFSYDSKKSGGVTISHLRFGDQPIRSSYLIKHADYIACHNQAYVNSYNLLEGIKDGGIFLLNCKWSDKELNQHLPVFMKQEILKKHLRFYTVDADHIARELGLGKRINMIMQTVFFALIQIIPTEKAEEWLKQEVRKNYGHQGQAVIDMNDRAIEEAPSYLHQVDVNVLDTAAGGEWIRELRTGDEDLDKFVNQVILPMNKQEGDKIPVSAFAGREDGTYPTDTTQYEKRGIALEVPSWDPDKCIQCNRCSFVCPHTAFRPSLLTEEEIKEAPRKVKEDAREARGHKGKYFYMGFSPLDCTGCGNCINICPAKDKALQMEALEASCEKETAVWEWVKDRENEIDADKVPTVKESQFFTPYFEFSGACAGCGETPYAKLVTQLFGDRMMISNSAGCTTVWGGSAPVVPYKKDKKGHGPAWGFSLFEDNGEYGLGMYLGYQAVRQEVKEKSEELKRELEKENKTKNELYKALCDWQEGFELGLGARERAERLTDCLKKDSESKTAMELYQRRDYLIKRSNWVFGGDGWAYDIGYGGLDHVLSTGADINIMVFDTEVYSNTGGQASKSTPLAAVAKFSAAGKRRKKKELGMMAMQYGDVYVAQVAMGADPNQTLKAILEAESYPGPSLIIGYAPCINHGIKRGMSHTQEQQKLAVEAGYWNLYRYDPRRKEEGKNPFVLDSGEPSGSLRDFLMSEVRFTSLLKKEPETAEKLLQQAEIDAKERYERYKRKSRQEGGTEG